MIGTAITKETKFQKFINDCQFPSPPPGQRQAEAKSELIPGTPMWKHTVKKQIINYIKENMPRYAAAICKENGGIIKGGQIAVCIFLENNLSFASETLLSQYDFQKYSDKKDPSFKSKNIVESSQPEACGFDEFVNSSEDFDELLSVLKKLQMEEPDPVYESVTLATPPKTFKIERSPSLSTTPSPEQSNVNNDVSNTTRFTN